MRFHSALQAHWGICQNQTFQGKAAPGCAALAAEEPKLFAGTFWWAGRKDQGPRGCPCPCSAMGHSGRAWTPPGGLQSQENEFSVKQFRESGWCESCWGCVWVQQAEISETTPYLWTHPRWLCHLLPGWQQHFKGSWVLPLLHARGGLHGRGEMPQIKAPSAIPPKLHGLPTSRNPNILAALIPLVPTPPQLWWAIQDSWAIMLLDQHFIFLWSHQRFVKYLLSSVSATA